jgi:hypothetical protein
MKRKHKGALRCAALCFAWVAIAGAQGAPEARSNGADPSTARLPVVVQVAGEACFESAAIAEEVASRSPRIALLPAESTAPRSVTIVIPAAAGAELGAWLTLEGAGAPLRRELWAKSCTELVRAIGFVISVTFDPPAPPRAEQEEPETPSPSGVAKGPAAAPPPRSSERSPQPHRDALAPIAAPRLWRIGPGVGGRVVWGVAPSPLWGVSALVDLQVYPPQSVGMLLRLEGTYGASQSYKSAGGTAVFRAWTGGAHVCAVWPLGGPWLLSPCLVGRGGMITAQGRATLESRRAQRPWWEIGGNALLQLRISPNWYLSTSVGGTRPLTRYAFQFEPDVFHRVSAWLADVGISTTTAF